jgi:hypothetical protein
MLGIMRVKNSETFLADYEKFIARYNGIAGKIESPMFHPAQVEKTEMDGTAALKVTMRMPQMPNMPPESVKMMERMYGPGGRITAWLVPCGEHAVVFSYMDREPLRKAIAAIKQGKPDLAADADVAKVAALLPKGATWSMYFSPKGFFEFLNRTLAAAPPPANAVKLPAFGPTPPVAMAMTSGPDEVEAHLVVPAEVVQEIGQLVGKMHHAPPPAAKDATEQ